MVMPPLTLVSTEWERSKEVRGHARRCKCLLEWDDISTKNADRKYHALKPLVRRPQDSTGDVGMHCLTQIQVQ